MVLRWGCDVRDKRSTWFLSMSGVFLSVLWSGTAQRAVNVLKPEIMCSAMKLTTACFFLHEHAGRGECFRLPRLLHSSRPTCSGIVILVMRSAVGMVVTDAALSTWSQNVSPCLQLRVMDVYCESLLGHFIYIYFLFWLPFCTVLSSFRVKTGCNENLHVKKIADFPRLCYIQN